MRRDARRAALRNQKCSNRRRLQITKLDGEVGAEGTRGGSGEMAQIETNVKSWTPAFIASQFHHVCGSEAKRELLSNEASCLILNCKIRKGNDDVIQASPNINQIRGFVTEIDNDVLLGLRRADCRLKV